MASASSSSNAITPFCRKYDVFLSFRGEDTRYNFVSHLYAALDRKKIKTYRDDENLERGHEISDEILQAIYESKLHVVIFSENYASSTWCLDELVHILQCRERNEQIVVPVFYHVQPSHVRKQEGHFGRAFCEVEKRFNDKTEKVKEWRAALTTISNISGWDSSVKRDEAKLVETIVEDIITKLKCTSQPSDDFEGLVGIKERIKQIESLLCISIHDHVRTIGIWGMGGIGKTTLANVVFSQFSSQFEGCCFLANIREEWTKGRKEYLQKKLSSELLGEKSPYNVKERLNNRRVLIVLDDVNDQEQLELLVGECRFGHGSRIIVTTRDMEMLRYIRANAIYQVQKLNQNEALQLFLLNAFKSDLFPTSEYIELSKRVVNYTEGIPLAVKVLGSFLRCKKEENWKKELDNIKQAPNDRIHNVLKVSYDGLREKERQIFLDIACFFKGMYRDYVEEILNACGFFAKVGIDSLIEKSLVTIRHSNILWMHDLVQEMALEIVLSTKEPGKRSRLWISQDIFHVLKNKSGTEEVEGIFLDTSEIGEVDLSPKVFKAMHNLRLLKIDDKNKRKLCFSRGLQYLPDALRYLNWNFYPLKSLPSNFSPHNLVELEMPHCELEDLWHGVQHLGNIKHIDLSFSKHLTQIPDLSKAPKLESLNLKYCTSLLKLPSLNFQTFSKYNPQDHYGNFPYNFTRHRGTLNLDGCSSLKSLPTISGNMKHLNLGYTAVEELPTSILSLKNFISLDLTRCNLKNLPSSIAKLESLKYLSLFYCSSFKMLPEIPRNIVKLDLSGTAIEEVPVSIKDVTTLEVLLLINCTRLKNLPTSLCQLKYLRNLSLLRCSKLESFPEILDIMESLQNLDLQETGIKGLPELSFVNLIELRNLLLDHCENLSFVPHSIFCISSLEKLSFSNCQLIQHLPARSKIGLNLVTELNMSNCSILKLPDWFGCLSSLKTLDLRGNLIDTIPKSIQKLSALIELQISNCKNLRSLPVLPLSLGFLDASGCTSLETVLSSKSKLVQGHWVDYHVTHYKEFLFCDCSNLTQKARKKIIIASQIRILRTAIVSLLEPTEIPYLFDEEKHSVCICYPGNKIPKWFSNQYEKSSITIKLNPNWYETNFIGFALSATVAHEDCSFECESIGLQCEFYFKTNYGESCKFICNFQDSWFSELRNDVKILNSDHVFMWYKYEDYRDYLDAVEVSFNFSLRGYDHEGYLINSCSGKFKKCGIRFLYLQDAEEFGIDTNPFEEEDDIFDDAESSGNETNDSDTDEPHPKRTKLSNF